MGMLRPLNPGSSQLASSSRDRIHLSLSTGNGWSPAGRRKGYFYSYSVRDIYGTLRASLCRHGVNLEECVRQLWLTIGGLRVNRAWAVACLQELAST